MNADEVRAGAAEISWYHSIDLGNGVVTPGASDVRAVTLEELPSFDGRSVLDIGAWDGKNSFLAERNGAQSVVALDLYAWGVDIPARDRYWQECHAKGVAPDHAKDLTDFFRADLPGKRGFEFAHNALDSKVESVAADFMTCDLDSLGTFDVVLLLGVLYHMKDPLLCLERARRVTSDVAVIETVALNVPAFDDYGMLEFFAGGELNADYGNWYTPNITALRRLCIAAGFSRVEVIVGPPPLTSPNPAARVFNRVTGRKSAVLGRYRAVVHAFV